jgi:hypothetical protein
MCVLPKSSVLLCVFCGQNNSVQNIFMKKYFLFAAESICRVKRFTAGSRNNLKDVQESQIMHDKVRKWLRQQSNYLCAAGFDALVKRWNMCSKVCRGYVEKHMFLFFSFTYMFYVLYLFMTNLLPLPSISFRDIRRRII